MSYIGPKAPVDEENGMNMTQGVQEVLKNIGYRYSISKAVFPDLNKLPLSRLDSYTVTLNWENSGVAPLYWNWDAYIYFVDDSIDGKAVIYHC